MAEDQDDDGEAVRLMRAFYEIRDDQARRIILAIVDAAARSASVKIEQPAELGMAILGVPNAGRKTSH
jgi:hypothetical protein